MNARLPSGLILISQPEQLRLSVTDMFDALPVEYAILPKHHVEIDVADLTKQAIRARDFGPAQRALSRLVSERLDPLRQRCPDYRFVYFGSASIPLTVQLGFMLETWQQIEVVPHHHTRRTWGWANDAKHPARLSGINLPNERDKSPGEAVIRVSTSHRVDRQVTLRAIPDPLVEIDISLEHPAEDAFTSLAEMQEVVEAFREALNTIGNKFSGVHRIHLFASVQPGVALLLGAQISATMHPPVQTYQYERHAENGPYHFPAILVNGPPSPPAPVLSEVDILRAREDRESLRLDVERMASFAERARKNPPANWIADALSLRKGHAAFGSSWFRLPTLHRTPLPKTTVDVESGDIDDSFRLNPENAWQIANQWLARLAKRIPIENERKRALRQLVLHEALHRGPQALTRTSSQGIGRFPRVLEEVDYHADVWAMLYEYALTESVSKSEVERVDKFFADMIRIATETMWAFDDDGSELHRIQIRRLNRYLIWYWQWLRLERLGQRADAAKLDEVLSILTEKPILELAGPMMVTRDERVYFELDAKRVSVPELGIYHDGELYRHGVRLDFSIIELLEGVRKRDGAMIRSVLRGAFEQTVRE